MKILVSSYGGWEDVQPLVFYSTPKSTLCIWYIQNVGEEKSPNSLLNNLHLFFYHFLTTKIYTSLPLL